MKTIGQRIAAARKGKNLSQAALAGLCGWKDGQSRISNYERDYRTDRMTVADVEKLAKSLEVAPTYLLFGDHAARYGAAVGEAPASYRPELKGCYVVSPETIQAIAADLKGPWLDDWEETKGVGEAAYMLELLLKLHTRSDGL